MQFSQRMTRCSYFAFDVSDAQLDSRELFISTCAYTVEEPGQKYAPPSDLFARLKTLYHLKCLFASPAFYWSHKS